MEMEEGNTTGGQGQPRLTAARTATMPRRSGVYEHFTDAQGDNNWQCKHCHLVVGANTNHGTSNLWKHLKKKCKGWGHRSSSLPQPQLQLQLQPSGPGEPSDPEPACQEEDEANRDLARMIAFHGYDPSVVEDDYFRSFVRRLDPQFEVPSRHAIEEICIGIFRDFREDMYCFTDDALLKVKFSLAVGEAKSIDTGKVVYVTIHFIDDDWNLHREVHDVRMALPVGDHPHDHLRQVPMVSLDDVVDCILTNIGGELATNQLLMIAGETKGHISHLKLKGCIEQTWGEKISSATYMDHVLHTIARCLLPDSEFAKNIFNTTKECLVLEQNEIVLTKHGLAKFGLIDDPWEYDERWYSCYFSLEILGQAFPHKDSEYTVLLRTLWRAIYSAIRGVSDSSRPTSNLCLKELFKVRDVLQLQTPDADAVHAGNYSVFGTKNASDVLTKALETIDKAIQDSYLVWSIPLVLDPRHKLRSIKKYFKKAFGLSEAEKYVSEVRRKIKEMYTSYNEDGDDDDEDSDGSTDEMSVDSTTQLDRYLQDSCVRGTEDFDILNWWKVYGSGQYPTVAWMARDALAMPTCSKLNPDQIAQVKSMLRGYHKY